MTDVPVLPHGEVMASNPPLLDVLAMRISPEWTG